MLGYIVKRLALLFPALLIVSFATFGLILAIPGNPAAEIAGPNATPEQIAKIQERLGLDGSIFTQYFSWLGGVVQGDFGNALMSGRPVTDLVLERIPVTLSLAFVTLAMGTILGVLFGTIAALKQGSALDRGLTIFSSLGIATPNYWVGLLLILVFSMKFGVLPSSQYVPLTEDPIGWAQHLILPGIALGAAFMAETARQVRSAVVEVKDLPYINTARSQGIGPWSIVGKYIAKNAALPVLTVIGLQFTRILGGTVLIEQIFSLPGIGTLMIDAVLGRDFPVVQGVVFGAVLVAIVVNLAVDLSYTALNPKVRSQWS